MSEEEKKAICDLKGKEITLKVNWTPEQKRTFEKIAGVDEFRENNIKVDILINLIEKKQQELQNLQNIDKEHQKLNGKLRKEIDELKADNKKITDEYMIQRHLINADFLKDYISKDKIRAIIEKSYKEIPYSNLDIIKDLKKLIEEE